MIVEEQVGDFINIYDGNMAFTANTTQRQWMFGDGDHSLERWQIESKRYGMDVTSFRKRYIGLCNAAAGWHDDVWSFRYEVVAQDGWGNALLQEIMNSVTEAIIRNNAAQDRDQCEMLLRRTVSLGMIRMNGLAIRKYIFESGKKDGSIVYRTDELTPYHLECLVSKNIRQSMIHKALE